MSSLLKLLGSTSFAQILLIAISPILTRLYSPDAFGEFLMITSWVYIINSLALGRMDIAILTSKTEKDIKAPFNLGLLFICVATALSLIIILFLKSLYDINFIYFLIPLAILSQTFYQLLISLLLTQQKFDLVAKNKIKQSMTLCFNQLTGGMLAPNTYTLSVAQSLSFIITSIFTFSIWKSYLSKIQPCILIKKYKNYIIYDNLSNFLQVSSNNLPAILITYTLGGYVGGLYYMAYRVLIGPTAIFSVSISQYISAGFREGQNNLNTWNQKNNYLLRMMLLTFCIPFILVSTYSESLFPIIFGQEWADTGKLIQSFATWIFLRLIYDSFIITLSLKQKAKIKMCMDIFIFIFTIITLITLGQMNFSGIQFLTYFAYTNTIAFLIVFCALNYFSDFEFIKNGLLVGACIFSIILYPSVESLLNSIILIIVFLSILTIFYKTRKRAL